jgi:hypothetical protein
MDTVLPDNLLREGHFLIIYGRSPGFEVNCQAFPFICGGLIGKLEKQYPHTVARQRRILTGFPILSAPCRTP